jgi:hypothetical protein
MLKEKSSRNQRAAKTKTTPCFVTLSAAKGLLRKAIKQMLYFFAFHQPLLY